jgi:hypothetical protein
MSVKVRKGEYVLVEVDEKMKLGRVQSFDDTTVSLMLQKDFPYVKDAAEYDRSQVRVNFGADPLPGRAYGYDLGVLHRGTIEHDFWGSIHFMYRPDKKTTRLLKNSLDRTAKRVEKLELTEFVERFTTEIRPKQGKWAGMYLHSKNDLVPHRVWYAPEWSQRDPDTMDNVIFHEFGHVVRHNGVIDLRYRGRWVSLWQKSIANVKIESRQLKEIRSLIESADPEEARFAQMLKEATADLGPRVHKAIVDWFNQAHNIKMRDLELLWKSGKSDQLMSLWPDHLIDTHDLKPVVSEYATKNSEELFAESFAFYCQKKKLPSKVQSLLDDSLRLARETILEPDEHDHEE